MTRLFSQIISKHLQSQIVELQNLLNTSKEINCSHIIIHDIDSISFPLELTIQITDADFKFNLNKVKTIASEFLKFPITIKSIYK